MRYLKEQVVSLSEAIRSPQSVPVYPDGLTQREVEVLRLIGLGSSNQQVAEELVITVRTVTNHVSNIFAKTGANNRVEAATYAIRNNLLSVISDGPVHSLIETRH